MEVKALLMIPPIVSEIAKWKDMMMSVFGLPLVPCGRPHSLDISRPTGLAGDKWNKFSEDSSGQGLMYVRLSGQSSEK